MDRYVTGKAVLPHDIVVHSDGQPVLCVVTLSAGHVPAPDDLVCGLMACVAVLSQDSVVNRCHIEVRSRHVARDALLCMGGVHAVLSVPPLVFDIVALGAFLCLVGMGFQYVPLVSYVAPLAVVSVRSVVDLRCGPVALDAGLGVSDVLDLTVPGHPRLVARIAFQGCELQRVQMLGWRVPLVAADAGRVDLVVVYPLGGPRCVKVAIGAVVGTRPMHQVQGLRVAQLAAHVRQVQDIMVEGRDEP